MNEELNSKNERNYAISGILKALKEINDKNGDIIAIGSLQCCEGVIDLIFYHNVWKEIRNIFNFGENMTFQEGAVALKGSIDLSNEGKHERPYFNVMSSIYKKYPTLKQLKEHSEKDLHLSSFGEPDKGTLSLKELNFLLEKVDINQNDNKRVIQLILEYKKGI